MPLYEYECDSCGHRFEVIQKFSDPLVKVCPECGCKVEKLLSSPAIQFKGSGFYINDYPRKGTSETSEQTSEKTSEKPAETAKAAATSDAKSSPSSSKSSASSGSTDIVSASSSSKPS
jgi:putative FmdB family regulatory protein